MRAKWKGPEGHCSQVEQYLKKGMEYNGPDHVVKEHIDNGLATAVKTAKSKKEK